MGNVGCSGGARFGHALARYRIGDIFTLSVARSAPRGLTPRHGEHSSQRFLLQPVGVIWVFSMSHLQRHGPFSACRRRMTRCPFIKQFPRVWCCCGVGPGAEIRHGLRFPPAPRCGRARSCSVRPACVWMVPSCEISRFDLQATIASQGGA